MDPKIGSAVFAICKRQRIAGYAASDTRLRIRGIAYQAAANSRPSGYGQLLFQNAGSDIHRCGAVEPSKAAVEIGKVAKANVVGDRADLLFPGPRLAEH